MAKDELAQINSRLDSIEEEQKLLKRAVNTLASNVTRAWHIALGISLGFTAKELGLFRIIFNAM